MAMSKFLCAERGMASDSSRTAVFCWLLRLSVLCSLKIFSNFNRISWVSDDLRPRAGWPSLGQAWSPRQLKRTCRCTASYWSESNQRFDGRPPSGKRSRCPSRRFLGIWSPRRRFLAELKRMYQSGFILLSTVWSSIIVLEVLVLLEEVFELGALLLVWDAFRGFWFHLAKLKLYYKVRWAHKRR